jgi:hypothetical protein
MNFKGISLLGVLILCGCPTISPNEDGGGVMADSACHPSQIDMTTPPPPCPAARGLTGEVIGNLCVDFSQDTIADLSTKGWNFMNAIPDCWEIAGGKLQIKMFSSFADNCAFKLPAINLNDADKQKYQSVTLAVVHRVHLDDSQQKAQILLGVDDPSMRLFKQETGRQPRQHNVYTVTRADLPGVVGGMFQPLFKLTSGAGFPYQGWQIESIAVIGNP